MNHRCPYFSYDRRNAVKIDSVANFWSIIFLKMSQIISEEIPEILKIMAVDEIFYFSHPSFFHYTIHMILECWTPWSEWGSCCGDCGNGERERSRSCTCGPPGCSNCPGDDQETEPCNEQSTMLWYFYPQMLAQLNLTLKYLYVKSWNPGFINRKNHRTDHLRANSCSLHD